MLIQSWNAWLRLRAGDIGCRRHCAAGRLLSLCICQSTTRLKHAPVIETASIGTLMKSR